MGKKKRNISLLQKGLGKLYKNRLNKQLLLQDEQSFTDAWFGIVEKSDRLAILKLAEATAVAVYALDNRLGEHAMGNIAVGKNDTNEEVTTLDKIVQLRFMSLEAATSTRPLRRVTASGREIGTNQPKSNVAPYKLREPNDKYDAVMKFYRDRDLLEPKEHEIDHEADVPGEAFSLGYRQRFIDVDKIAKAHIKESFRLFGEGQSFWAIVQAIPENENKVAFFSKNNEAIPFYSSITDSNVRQSILLSGSHTEGMSNPKKVFDVERVRKGLVVTATDGIEWNEKDLPTLEELPVPDGYDLLINPAFFAGRDFRNVSRDSIQDIGESLTRQNYVSTLAEATGQGFMCLFGDEWTNLVDRVEKACKDGNDPYAVPWPLSLSEDDSGEDTTPAPAYWDIPKGYNTYAAGLLLRMYRDNDAINNAPTKVKKLVHENGTVKVGVREVWAAGGAVGMYSFVRRTVRPERMTLFAMLREAVYGCRSTHLGIVLHHAIDFDYHDDFTAFCSMPFSHMDRGVNMAMTGKYMSRYLMKVESPNRRWVMNFAASMGFEFMNNKVPSLIQGHVSVVSDAFADVAEAKEELKWFANRYKLLPGAAIRAAEPGTDTDGGILNVVQPRQTDDGHVKWMEEYNFFQSIAVQILIVGATIYGWLFDTGVFHFLLALAFLTFIEEEVCIVGTARVLFLGGKKDGWHLRGGDGAELVMTVALGSVEAANGNLNQFWFRIVLIGGGGIAFSILFFTMLARLQFENIDGTDHESVVRRDGSMECLLTGEVSTGFRGGDHRESPGVGPLQAHNADDSNYNGINVPTTTNKSAFHLSGNWVLAGTINTNPELKDSQTSATTESQSDTKNPGSKRPEHSGPDTTVNPAQTTESMRSHKNDSSRSHSILASAMSLTGSSRHTPKVLLEPRELK